MTVLEFIRDLNVKIPRVFLILLYGDQALHRIPHLPNQHMLHVKDRLLPVGVAVMWRCIQDHRFMALGEHHIEPCNLNAQHIHQAISEHMLATTTVVSARCKSQHRFLWKDQEVSGIVAYEGMEEILSPQMYSVARAEIQVLWSTGGEVDLLRRKSSSLLLPLATGEDNCKLKLLFSRSMSCNRVTEPKFYSSRTSTQQEVVATAPSSTVSTIGSSMMHFFTQEKSRP